MNELKTRPNTNSNDIEKVIYMNDGASVRTRILFYNKNIYKISYAKFLNALSFLMRRIAIFPLLMPLDYTQNFMNLVYLIVTFSFSITAN